LGRCKITISAYTTAVSESAGTACAPFATFGQLRYGAKVLGAPLLTPLFAYQAPHLALHPIPSAALFALRKSLSLHFIVMGRSRWLEGAVACKEFEAHLSPCGHEHGDRPRYGPFALYIINLRNE